MYDGEVDLRGHFGSESADFTLWLNENIHLLLDLIGIEIIDSQLEQGIGSCRLDIAGIDANTKQMLLSKTN